MSMNIGDVVIQQGNTTNWQSIVARADPVAGFAHEILLDVLLKRNRWPAEVLTLDPPSNSCNVDHPCTDCVPLLIACFIGWKVTVIGANASYVYIIKSYDMQDHSWIGAWPD